tara:strand:- start:1547 stop:2170 length:624 start_codon:yes stop_codon:yes gene_type:complete
MSVNISIEHINILEKEIAFMKEQKDVMDKRLTEMKEKNVALAKRLSSTITRLERDNKRVAIAESKYDELDDEMTLIKAEKDTMVDAWNVAVKKGQGFETALREERVKYNSLMAELELSKAKCASLAEKECEVKLEVEEFVKPLGIIRVMWKEHYFYMDDDGNLYEHKHEYKLDAKPIGKWNAETKTCSWYVKMLFDKLLGGKPMRLE